MAGRSAPHNRIRGRFAAELIEGPLGRAHRRPSIYALHTVSDRRREACNQKQEIAWGRNRDGLHCREEYRNGIDLLICGATETCVAWSFAFEVQSAASIFAQNEARCDTKNGNVTSEPRDKADDAKCSFRKRAINKKHTFFQWILQISGWNKWCKKGAYRHNWRA